jgi:hypothetical protein
VFLPISGHTPAVRKGRRSGKNAVRLFVRLIVIAGSLMSVPATGFTEDVFSYLPLTIHCGGQTLNVAEQIKAERACAAAQEAYNKTSMGGPDQAKISGKLLGGGVQCPFLGLEIAKACHQAGDPKSCQISVGDHLEPIPPTSCRKIADTYDLVLGVVRPGLVHPRLGKVYPLPPPNSTALIPKFQEVVDACRQSNQCVIHQENLGMPLGVAIPMMFVHAMCVC